MARALVGTGQGHLPFRAEDMSKEGYAQESTNSHHSTRARGAPRCSASLGFPWGDLSLSITFPLFLKCEQILTNELKVQNSGLGL